MFGDESKLRLRRNVHTDGAPVLPILAPGTRRPPQPTISFGGQVSKVRRKRRRRREIFKKFAKTCLSGLAAALVSSSLSVLLLPFSWTQVDYHHQLQRAATHLVQRVEENRHNYATAIRGRHSQPKVLCSDGTVGFENDDYCDCPDGIDEPSTSACSHLHVHQPMFICKGDRSQVIYASRVRDGVRDCSDGSDEA